MTFLDSSTIIQYLNGNRTVQNYLDESNPWQTSTLCVFEVVNGPAGTPGFDPVDVRQQFAGVEALEFNEQFTQRLADSKTVLSARDAMIAATARSTGDEYVVADGDFDISPLTEHMPVTNLADPV